MIIYTGEERLYRLTNHSTEPWLEVLCSRCRHRIGFLSTAEIEHLFYLGHEVLCFDCEGDLALILASAGLSNRP